MVAGQKHTSENVLFGIKIASPCLDRLATGTAILFDRIRSKIFTIYSCYKGEHRHIYKLI